MKNKTPNPTGRHGKPIILPPTTFEDAVNKSSTLPRHLKEDKPKKDR